MINYKIDAKLLDKLYVIRLKLKKSLQYDRPVMGLCLLGEKDGVVDSFVPMITSKGCWDAPEISYATFDNNFRKIIKMGRVCVGMAMIRPDNYGPSISTDMRVHIHSWRKAFLDIEKTVWICVSQYNIICYKVKKGEGGRFSIAPYENNDIYMEPEKSKALRVAEVSKLVVGIPLEKRSNIEKCARQLGESIDDKKSSVKILKTLDVLKEDIIKTKEDEARKEKEREKESARMAKLDSDKKKMERAARKSIKDIGHGLILIKDKNGREVLWQK